MLMKIYFYLKLDYYQFFKLYLFQTKIQKYSSIFLYPTHAGRAGWLHALSTVTVLAEKRKYTELRQKKSTLHHQKQRSYNDMYMHQDILVLISSGNPTPSIRLNIMNQFQLSWIAASRIKQSIFQHLL
jgi:hypothetical protein